MCQSVCQKAGKALLIFVCLITGQYIPPVKNPKGSIKSKCCSLFWLAYFVIFTSIILLVNIFPTVMTVCLAAHPLEYYGVSYSIVLYGPEEDSTAIPDIVLREVNGTYDESRISLTGNHHSGTSLNSSKTRPFLVSFEFFSQVTLSLSSFSSSLSYFFFCIALARLYVYPHVLNLCNKYDGFAKPILHPFNNKPWHSAFNMIGTDREPLVRYRCRSVYMNRFTTNDLIESVDIEESALFGVHEDKGTSTQLKPTEGIIFIGIILVNVALNILLYVLFIAYGLAHSGEDEKLRIDGSHDASYYTKIEILEWTTSATYMYSVLSSMASCLIFSKVAYGVQKKCVRLANCMDDLYKPKSTAEGDKSERDFRFNCLMKQDNRFIEITKSTLWWFEIWFFIHWILYIATSILSFSLFIQAVYLKNRAESQSQNGVDFSSKEIGLIGIFSLSNSIFFLYPCLCAAAITESRSRLMRKVNKKRGLQHISQDLVKGFEEYLNNQKFSFNFRLLCFKVPFGYKMAIGSIAIALLGLILEFAFPH